MTKLHELIAVEQSLAAEARGAVKRANSTLTTGGDALRGEIRSYEPLQEDGERLPSEVHGLALTVDNLLAELEGSYSGWLDVAVQKEINNSHTSADVTIDNKVILKGMSSTSLLNLEGKLAELRSVYSKIPVLDPTEQWHFDTGLGHWVSSERVTNRSKKEHRVIVKYDATKEHPAQTEIVPEDVTVGRWTKIVHSGALTAEDKRIRLANLDRLLRAVKKARQRANDLELKVTDKYAQTIFRYINKGTI